MQHLYAGRPGSVCVLFDWKCAINQVEFGEQWAAWQDVSEQKYLWSWNVSTTYGVIEGKTSCSENTFWPAKNPKKNSDSEKKQTKETIILEHLPPTALI